MKKIVIIGILISVISCAELQQVMKQLPSGMGNGMPLTERDIATGLRSALEKGVRKEVTKLGEENGFYGNEAVRILLPEELKKVERTLRKLGMGKLADNGIRALNRAAEDAVKEAIPIFSDAITTMTFTDAKQILLGQNNAATQYLQNKTQTALYSKFSPIIRNSFAKVGADRIWNDIITQYNQLPLLGRINPDLTDYTTQQALGSVFKMIAVEEKEIRTKLSSRTTELLRRVFALQDSNRQAPMQKEQDTYLD